MPELPEVEAVARSVSKHVVGRRVVSVRVRRADVIEGPRTPAAMLLGCTILTVERHGKQMAMVTDGGPCVCVHLGMTGSLRCVATDADETRDKHAHVVWSLDSGAVLVFRDPRRFGGLWTFASRDALLRDRWSGLGDDALNIEPADLHAKLRKTRRGMKATLLDQSVLAGLGNIYVDELLFACGIHPLKRASSVDATTVAHIATEMRRILREAIGAGGSTLRDYVDADGGAGTFQARHKVYGRAGEPCVRCGAALRASQAGGRTTVFCPTCQPRRGR